MYIANNFNNMSDKEIGKKLHRSSSAINCYRFRNRLMKTYEKSSYLDLSEYIRRNNIEWKKNSMKKCSYRCVLSGKRFDDMLQDYTDGEGSMQEEAEKTANSWEGSLNRLSNTFDNVVANIINSDDVISGINLFNSLISEVEKLTGSLNLLTTAGLAVGAVLGKKKLNYASI